MSVLASKHRCQYHKHCNRYWCHIDTKTLRQMAKVYLNGKSLMRCQTRIVDLWALFSPLSNYIFHPPTKAKPQPKHQLVASHY